MSWRNLVLLLALPLLALPLLALSACGDLPRPFEGRPGSLASRLAQPPPARLAVVAPTQALLTTASAAQYAAAVATAMQEEALPAVAEPARPGDWRLELLAELRGAQVIPSFRVRDPAGIEKGRAEASAVPAAAWADAAPETLRRAGREAAPTLATLLAGIEAARREADPNSLVNRPVRVQLQPVIGAPGDGNATLASALQRELSRQGIALVDKPGSSYRVEGKVVMGQTADGKQPIQIDWRVKDPQGKSLGTVSQKNEIPPGSLDGPWGKVADAAAAAAAQGIIKLLPQVKSTN